MNDEFQKVVIDPLLQQEKEIGDDIKKLSTMPDLPRVRAS
jgi:hypothetical protein